MIVRHGESVRWRIDLAPTCRAEFTQGVVLRTNALEKEQQVSLAGTHTFLARRQILDSHTVHCQKFWDEFANVFGPEDEITRQDLARRFQECSTRPAQFSFECFPKLQLGARHLARCSGVNGEFTRRRFGERKRHLP